MNLAAIFGLGTEIVASEHWSFSLGARYHFLFGQETDSVGLSS